MARRKRTSPVLDKANTRSASLTSINSALDLGNGLTLAGYKSQIAATQTKLDNYNALLSSLDSSLNDLVAQENELRKLTDRMLGGVATKFGKDSNEYEMAGGTRTSERKRPTRKKKTP